MTTARTTNEVRQDQTRKSREGRGYYRKKHLLQVPFLFAQTATAYDSLYPERFSVPGPPEWATLDVIGSNSLKTTFAPPLWDGGMPVTSYLVEWDKEAGIPEVQRIATSLNLNTNEIQSITTSVPDLNEIQVVQTSATPQPEIQEITVSPPSVDSTVYTAYSFALILDTIEVGGSIQYSGQISANAAADGSRSSLAEILENMSNIMGRPTVERSTINPDGGHTYTVTFPISMGNVPQFEVFMSDVPISISTLQEGNEIEGSFRLEFMGELTADIPFDASESELQKHLENLNTVGAVSVSRSLADDQKGFSWGIEFLSDVNGGNVDSIIVHSDGLRTSNPIGGATAQLLHTRDGSFISGSFTIDFRGEKTNPISFDADAFTIKKELEALSTISRVHVDRTPLDIVGGCTWTIAFLDDGSRMHQGDMPMFIVESTLTGAPGQTPSIKVLEVRKGTFKEIQTIAIDGGGGNVDPTSSFRLSFEGEETGDILALPMDGSTCLGSTKAKQIITTSTVDTSGVGGDDSVSHLTSFALLYAGHKTSKIMANAVSCEETSSFIASELLKIPQLHDISVSGSNTDAGGQGFTAFNEDIVAGPGYSVTLGDSFSIIQDTITISQPEYFKGDVNLIQSELSKLSNIGPVSVTPLSPIPDEFGQCSWEITFEGKAGDVASIQVAPGGTSDFSTNAEMNSGNRVFVIDDTTQGTSTAISGDFRLEFDGEVTGYLPFDASSDQVKASLDALNNIGTVDVTRSGPDVNGCLTWDVTFVSNLGPLPLIDADGSDLLGTVASISVSKKTTGILPAFNGPDYGSQIISDTSDFSLVINGLKQGIPYYVRISALNEMGLGPSVMPYPPFQIPFPQPPAPPSQVRLKPKDGSAITVEIDSPPYDGGESISSYRIDYSTQPFVQERQRVSLTCSPTPEVQTITTSAADINEIQYIVIDTSYSGNGRIFEVQKVECEASGGTFGLALGGETTYINHDANAEEIKEALELLPLINEVSISLNQGTTTACTPFDGSHAGDFSITFKSLSGVAGDLPLMTPEKSGLEGARIVDVTSVVDGDAPLSGTMKLSFRGSITQPINVELDGTYLANDIDTALEALDTIQQEGVSVSKIDLANGGHEKIFRIEFEGNGVGGNVEPLVIVPDYFHVIGSSADAFVLTDGESYWARNGVDVVTSRVGNEIFGNFKVKLRGHESESIPFNASEDEMKAKLEALPNIGKVDVQITSGPSKEKGYTWMVTFRSNPGYFPPATRDADLFEVISELSTSVETDSSASITVETINDGDAILEGEFKLSFDDGTTSETTSPLQSFISADDLKFELESLPNVGRVNVIRSESLVGFNWDVEFISCSHKNGLDVCNDGNLISLIASDVSLRGCGNPSLSVSELISGNGPGPCPALNHGLCFVEEPFNGDYPIIHEISGLTIGTPYYVQVRFRNSQSYGYRQLSTPNSAIPRHNPPGPPPPVLLKESSSTSITVGWLPPRENGGTAVSGYELWMDSWSGGEKYMIYDGSGSPDKFEYRLSTNDVGPQSQIVETGRQYMFQVRAMNNCDMGDPARACYGEFSELQLFTVRDPRTPLPPSAPRRDSRTGIRSLNKAAIHLSWTPPVDNGGSPITGYILYMRDPNGVVTNVVLGKETTTWIADSLRPGQVYRFHLVATNSLGKSGNSPTASILAANHPGFDYDGQAAYFDSNFRPDITDVQERSLTTKWSHLPANMSGGSPITGFKLYLYEDVRPSSQVDSDPINLEVQQINFLSENDLSGTFTANFRGFETTDIPIDASAEEVKFALENLPSINVVFVEVVSDGWRISFLSEAGDLPLIEVTSGRLLGDESAQVVVTEITKGDPAILIYDGSESPATRTFTVKDLIPETRYAFKVAPVNAVGDGILSSSSVATFVRVGASASETTASGSSLSRGIAGSIQEEQIVTFLSNDCASDKLVLTLESSSRTDNLCGASASEFETAIERLMGVGKLHVSREVTESMSGHSGYSWTVTFKSRMGDVPLLNVDVTQVGNGRDAYGKFGLDAKYVIEFLKGQANEFTIEPKTASGSVVDDVTVHVEKQGGDIFFTELWTSDVSVLDGSHEWYSDGGVSTYNALHYEEQIIAIPHNIGTFQLSMNTLEDQPQGRIDGEIYHTRTFNGIADTSAPILQEALSELKNVGAVDVTESNEEHDFISYFKVTFKEMYGGMPLIVASDPSIIVGRNGGQSSSTEIQTINISADMPFIYEVQSISVSSTASSFDLSFMDGPRTQSIPCDFATVDEAKGAISAISAALNSLPGIEVRLSTEVSGIGSSMSPWIFRVTFIEPVGPIPLLQSNNADIVQVVQGESTLSGSLVLSYQGEYTGDIPFAAPAVYIKSKLEELETIAEVDVKRVNKHIGYQWMISFVGNLGNLPLIVAHNNIFEVQEIKITGGQPTPLGGKFSLSYLSEETGSLPFDSSAEMIKASLESLQSIERVDVSREEFNHGQCQWLVTFRSPHKPALLHIKSHDLSGALDDASVTVKIGSISPSLVAVSGSPPTVVIEETVPGLPSYTGQYTASTVGNYTLAVMQLESGGLSAKYYDNQWLFDSPVIERVDSTINFNWGLGLITQYGRDYISIRWWGKVRPHTTEDYTFYLYSDDGARLYINHKLILDLWEDRSVEKKAKVYLTAGFFHDLKLEYKEVTGDAYIHLFWSSRSLQKQVIPSNQLFYSSHIQGSPFSTTISPGAADYPYSDFIEINGQNRSIATAGDQSSFYLQAKDSSGNVKLSNGDAQGDIQSPVEQFSVDIVGDNISYSGIVTYLESGKYRVDYTVLKTGIYQVHVQTGGTDIYCGLGQEKKCSPFRLSVIPGAAVASNCEAESSSNPIDNLVEARAGDTGKIFLQAKDSYGNNRISGGDDVKALFTSVSNHDIQYRGNIIDTNDGRYIISYSIPIAGNYIVSITLGDEPVKYCVRPSDPRWDSREYDGISVYSSPSFCSLNDSLNLVVVHRELHGVSSTLVDNDIYSGLSNAIVGVEAGFIVESRDKFGNIRSGSSTSNIEGIGDGQSDTFLVTLESPSGRKTLSSSAVQTISCSDSSTSGSFRLSFGGVASQDLPHDVSASTMKVVLSTMNVMGKNLSVQVVRLELNGNYQWKITFLSHLDLWSQEPLSILPRSDDNYSIANLLSTSKESSSGIYPIHYTLWETGIHEVTVNSGTSIVSGSSYSIEVTNSSPQASSSSATGNGLKSGIAGEQTSFKIQLRDQRQEEVQAIMAKGAIIEFINEIQRLTVSSNIGDRFHLEFRGQNTVEFEVGTSTCGDIVDGLEALSSIGRIQLPSNSLSQVINSGDVVDIEFVTERGSLDLITSSGHETVTKLQQGEAPYRPERQAFNCDADGGFATLTFGDKTSRVDFDDTISVFSSKLSFLTGSTITIVDPDDFITTICDSQGKIFFIDFPLSMGDVRHITVDNDSLQNGSMFIFGDGEDHTGAVNGISPVMGHFTIVVDGETTIPISVDASADILKESLEKLSSIGSVSVSKDTIGIHNELKTANDPYPYTSLFPVWTITFSDENAGSCRPGSWMRCPTNVGDLPLLRVDDTMIRYEIGASQQQSAPEIIVLEVTKGSEGNVLEHVDDEVEIEFSLSHDMMPQVGVGMQEVHSFSCSYSQHALESLDTTGSFEIEITNSRIRIDASSTLDDMKLILQKSLNLSGPVSSIGSSHGTLCHFNKENPTTVVTLLTFSAEDGPIPAFSVRAEENVHVMANNLVDAVDGIEYVGQGLYVVKYTPTISGHYSISIEINHDYLRTDLSSGFRVDTAVASAQHSTHNSHLVAIAGVEETFQVVARDRFGNTLPSLTSHEDFELDVTLHGVPNPCNSVQREDDPIAIIEILNNSSNGAHYNVAYTPTLAGEHFASITLRSRGGLLATYYKNQDFSQPLYGNLDHHAPPYHEAPWCKGDESLCDSTKLDTEISFFWGLESPLPSEPSYPIDFFSVSWEGDIKVDLTDDYTFSIRLANGGARLLIGSEILIESFPETDTDLLSSSSISLEKDKYYSIKVQYSHSVDESMFQLLWESSTTTTEVVPSKVLFFTRHIGGSPMSPFALEVVPGALNSTSDAFGSGVATCTALEECSFVIQTKDSNRNNRYNDGSNPNLEISIIGTGGWAAEGRVNSIASSSPITISDWTMTSNEWDYIGTVNAEHLSYNLSTNGNFVGLLSRGDKIVVLNMEYTISSTGVLDASNIPITTPFMGESGHNVDLYKAGKMCLTGSHTVAYTPKVSGSYQIDIKTPKTPEVQQVAVSAATDSKLSGTFTIVYLQPGFDPISSGSISFDSTAEDFEIALENMSDIIGSVEVSRHNCANPAISCSWNVTFLSFHGDANMLLPTKSQLRGVGDVAVQELVKGHLSKSIIGMPRTIDVSAGDIDPSVTTAFGKGLVKAKAGEKSTFSIQPKDGYGNNKQCENSDLFYSAIYPEAKNDDSTVVSNTQQENIDICSFNYVPLTSGFHTVAIVYAKSRERQVITTNYDDVVRAGTFKISLGTTSTLPIPWDADQEEIKQALDSSLKSISIFTVEKQSHSLYNFKYVISFDTALGDIEPLSVDTSNIIGSTKGWDVATVNDGRFSHIKMTHPICEIQKIEVMVVDPSTNEDAVFSLEFMGQTTEQIPWDSDAVNLRKQMENLPTIGDVDVSLDVGSTFARAWLVTFKPNEGRSKKSLRNFGDLPLIQAKNVHTSISIRIEGVQNGSSPFRVLVSPSDIFADRTVSFDRPGVNHFEGLSTGVYNSKTHFYIQTRDKFSNDVTMGPLNEIQIIETSSSAQLDGFFKVSFFGMTWHFPANTFTSEIEKAFESIPGLGSVSVSSTSAKDLVVDKTVSVIKGLDIITPNVRLDEYIVGDWIRIGDRDNGPLFSIVAIEESAPFTLTLSSPYVGESVAHARVYQHGLPMNRKGYQYIVSFESALGDVPQLDVSGELLEGADAKVEVTSCDWNAHQNLRVEPTSTFPVDGFFYLVYGEEQTRLLNVDISAEDLRRSILLDIDSIHSLVVNREENPNIGVKSWAIHLQAYDSPAELFHAENFLVIGGHAFVSNNCPAASQGSELYSVKSVAGRRGQDFVVTINGISSVRGKIDHVEDGKYLASYVTPRVGKYSLAVLSANFGGLFGEYFNNRWLYGEPISSRVDQSIDFNWAVSDSVSPTGKDFVSIRWTGYIKPSFNEVYTFTAHVNDALRLWIADELLIDEYDNEVEDEQQYEEYSSITSARLSANQLVPIKLEYRENRGSAMIRLFWESLSQPFTIIDSNRLFYNCSHINGSPFEVTPKATKPSRPRNCSVGVSDWSSLQVNWSNPIDDGGSAVTKYAVESWDANEYGVTEKQQLILKNTIDEGTFVLTLDSHSAEVPVGSTAADFEKLIESLPNVGDVQVTKTFEPETTIYDIEFMTNTATVPIIGIHTLHVKPRSERDEYCVCAKGEIPCNSGSMNISCKIENTREGTIATQRSEISVADAISLDGMMFTYTIHNLQQPSYILDGFGVRVSAGNVEGFGIPCAPKYLKPSGPPLPPAVVEVARVANDPQSIVLHFTSVSHPEDRGSAVSGFVIEWSTTENFRPNTSFNTTLNARSVSSERLPSHDNVGKEFNKFFIENLTPGRKYFVRIAAMNDSGVGPFAPSQPSSITPGAKPSDFDSAIGVTIDALLADSTTSVMESSSSLRVSWRAPASNNGFHISNYLIEYWISDSMNEVQDIVIQSVSGSPAYGAFTLAFEGDATDSLSVDSSAETVKVALENLRTIRSVRVWRSGVNPDYKWSVTFLSEYPSSSGSMITIIQDKTKLIDDVGETPSLRVDLVTRGELPTGYNSIVVPSEEYSKVHYEYILTELTAGQPYKVQVSASNYLGFGRPHASHPSELAPPVQKPSIPTNIILQVASRNSLEVIFSKPESNGGDAISLYRIDWDTNQEFDSANGVPIGSYTYIPSNNCEPCSHQITALIQGQNYFVRVYSYNSRGYSFEPGIPTPSFLSPKAAADPPESLTISPHSDTAINIQFPPSSNDGGASVKSYKVEWNGMGYIAGLPSTNRDNISALYSPYNVQSVHVTADDDNVSGVFRLAFRGHSTDDISVSATADELKNALEILPTVGSITVSKEYYSNGFVWAVTFLTDYGNESSFGPIPSLSISINPTDMPDLFATEVTSVAGTSLLGTGARIAVKNELVAFKGYEQQKLTTQCKSTNGLLSGYFSLSIGNTRTKEMPHDVTAMDLKRELENIRSIGEVKVLRRIQQTNQNSFEWTIIFLEKLGNVPMLSVHDHLACSDGSVGPFMYAVENAQGVLPRMDGPFAGEVELNAFHYVGQNVISHTIRNLTRGMRYHFRVSAWNGHGESYGQSRHSTPATIIPVDNPGPPTSIHMTTVDNKTLKISWSAALSRGDFQGISKHSVELAENPTAYNEVQQIIITASDPLSGKFKLGFDGSWTRPIPANADASQISSAITAMPNMGKISASTNQSGIHSSSWMITFEKNVGDLPLLTIDTAWLGESHISAEVVEIVPGRDIFSGDDHFNFQRKFTVEHTPEVQEIILESSANDMGGYFFIHFMGERSSKIYVDSDATTIQRVLEGVSTIDEVTVSIIPHTQDSISLYGQRWVVTFKSHRGDLPSLLVDSGSGPASTITTGGTLLGSSPLIRVETKEDGGIRTNFVTPSILNENKTYAARISSFNGYSWSTPAHSKLGISPSKSVPSSPREVRVNVLSNTELGVSWKQPNFSGGDEVAGYKVQWDVDTKFDHSSAAVRAIQNSTDYFFVVRNLDPFESYFVRVIAYNAQGFSEPEIARHFLLNMNTIMISLIETGGNVDLTETFSIRYTSNEGIQRETNPISVIATSREVENELNIIGINNAVSVDRENRSNIFDLSGIETNYFDIRYRLSLVGDQDIRSISINDENLGSIVPSVDF